MRTSGDEGDNFYVVEQGRFDVYVSSKKVVELFAGGAFGELALLYNSPRAATVMAATSAKLWALDRVTFRHIIAHSSAQQQRECRAALRRTILFDDLSEDVINMVAAAVQVVTFREGQTIIKKGTRGQVFYLIKEGTVVCTNVGAGKKEQEDITFTVGDYFGERSLLKDAPRAANVIAKTPVTLMALDKEDFDNLLGQAHMKTRLEYNMGIRVLQCVPIFRSLSADEREETFDAMQKRKYKGGAVLVKQGSPNNTFFIVQEGVVKEIRDGSLVREIGAGEWFGDDTLRSGTDAKASFAASVSSQEETKQQQRESGDTRTHSPPFVQHNDVRFCLQGSVELFCLEKEAFTKLLGPLETLMNRASGTVCPVPCFAVAGLLNP